MTSESRIAWRLGFRLATRHRARSLLVCLAIALPVAVGVALAAVSVTAQISLPEAKAAAYGSAAGVITTTGDASTVLPPQQAAQQITPLLPPGSTTAFDTDVLGLRLTGTGGLEATVNGRIMDLSSPIIHGVYRVDTGTPANKPGTIMLSTALATALHVSGHDAQVDIDGHPWAVTALLSDRTDTNHRFFVLPPDAAFDAQGQAVLSGAKTLGAPRWFVTPPPATDMTALSGRLQEAGYSYSPNARAAALADPDVTADSTALLVSFGLLAEIILLVTAVFAVVVRTQRRHMGLLAAIGAPTRITSSFFRAHALCIAVAGSLLGLGLGQIAARLLVGPLARRAAQDWGPVDGAWSTDAILIAVTVGAAVVAAALPARKAVRTEPMQLLSTVVPLSAGNTIRVRKAATWCLAAAVAAAAMAMAASDGPALALAGALVFVCGITGTVLAATAVASRLHKVPHLRGSLPLRSATRSLMAFPARAAVSITALGVVVAVAATVLITVSSVSQKQKDEYQPAIPRDAALVLSPRPLTDAEAQSLANATKADNVSTGYRRAVTFDKGHNVAVLPLTDFEACIRDKGLLRYGTNDWHGCFNSSASHLPSPTVGIADTQAVQAIAGQLTPAQAEAYQQGGLAVALSPAGLNLTGPDPTVTLTAMAHGNGGFDLRTVGTLPLAAGARSGLGEYLALPKVMISPTAARALDMVPIGTTTYFVHFPAKPASAEQLRRALPVDAQAEATISIEQGPSIVHTLERLRVIVAVAAIATTLLIAAAMVSLWITDLRGEYQMIGAIGASACWQRRAAATLAALMIAAGAIAGLIWGITGMTAFLASVRTPMVMPYAWLAAVALGALVAGAAAGAAVAPRRARALRQM
ncbi:FtsX-like permease family protein [Kitasatospora sp. NPDC006697]|uniref:FtsX-like permease family protein n=1 Tax=Kitasatospora sp. NPDC006697 TaxID=3364020 RepID=UPI00367EE7B1